MLKVGIVGCGFMGRMHYRCWKALPDVEVAAVCDANPAVAQQAKQAGGNIAGAEEGIDFNCVAFYTDAGKMFEEAELDAVSITLPTHTHADITEEALASGLHVLCEKPMALNEAQCRRMIKAADKSGKVMMIAHCIRFWPEYAKAKEIVDSGEYGKVLTASFNRCSSPPNWAADNWFIDEKRSGGMLLDLHIHDADFVQYLFGMPQAVASRGVKRSDWGWSHIVTDYIYSDDKMITAKCSWLVKPSFGFEMSFIIKLEKATIVYDCTRQPAFRVCPAEGEVFTPKVKKGDGYSLEIAHFADLVRGKKVAQVITPQQSCNSIKLIAAEKESAAKGEKIFLS